MPALGDLPQVIQDFTNKVLPDIGGMDALEAGVSSAQNEAHDVLATEQPPITDANSFIAWMTALLQWVPQEDTKATEVLRKICVFYFILDQPRLMMSQTEVDPNSVGNGLTTLSEWLVQYANAMGTWLYNPASLTPDSFQTFKDSPLYRVWECVSPDGTAFKCFNDFFGRELAKDRPVDGPGDNHTPVYPADSLYDACFDVDMGSNTWIPAGSLADRKMVTAKGWTWSIGALLQGSQYGSSFAGGVWVHSFLSTYNYHRFRSPVTGTVVDAGVIQNAAYLDVVATGSGIVPRRKLRKALRDGDAGAEITPKDQSGYQFLQTRGYVVIDTSKSSEGDIGLVAGMFFLFSFFFFLIFLSGLLHAISTLTPKRQALTLNLQQVLPIGMAQVSSVILTVKPGDPISKGGKIGYFQFGGSDIVTVFQAKTGLKAESEPFNKQTSKDENNQPLPYTFYGSWLAKIPSSQGT